MDFRARLYCIEKQLADQPILDHLPQIAVALFGNEIQRAGFQLVAHPYLFDRASLALQRVAKADGREQLHAGTGNCGNAAVKIGGQHGLGIGTVNHMACHAMCGKGERLGKAVQAAADDDDVGDLGC